VNRFHVRVVGLPRLAPLQAHSPRAERMAEKSPSTRIASSVQTKRSVRCYRRSLLVTPTPFPSCGCRARPTKRANKRNMMM